VELPQCGQLTAIFCDFSLASSDMAPKNNMSQYMRLNLREVKTGDIKITSHSFAMTRTDYVIIARSGNNRMLQSYCHSECGLTFMLWGLNDTLLINKRNSMVLSFQN
jgi:hypothetical protein